MLLGWSSCCGTMVVVLGSELGSELGCADGAIGSVLKMFTVDCLAPLLKLKH